MEEFLNDFAWGFRVYIESFFADPKHKETVMKRQYEEILNTTTGGYRFESCTAHINSLRQMEGFLFLVYNLKSPKIAYFRHTIVSI